MGELEHMRMTYESLKQITNDFSTEIGRGRYGVVYKGQGSDGQELAVKKLTFSADQRWDDDTLEIQMSDLAKIKHPNIMQLLGYWYETTNGFEVLGEKLVFEDKLHMAFCYEYMHNGSLHQYLYDDEDTVHSWRECYRIIKGICEGLKCLHMDFETPILHLNLKPTNILLSENTVPKIADFGLTNLSGWDCIPHDKLQLEYYPPEYIKRGEITKDYDIFSLGVIIIKIMVGHKGYSLVSEMDAHSFIEHVCNKWMTRLAAIPGYTTLHADCQQVKKCIETALRCTLEDRNDRPNIGDIVELFNKSEKHTNDSAVWTEENLVPRVNSLTVQQGTSVTQGDANSEVVPTSQGLYPDTVHKDSRYMELNVLERILNGSVEPDHLDLALLQSITENFSKKREIGSSECGIVYKGILRNGNIAVKRLRNIWKIEDETFHQEVISLTSIKHQNIVRFLGYCSCTEDHKIQSKGRTIIAEIREKLLCFEYISNGSLENHLTDELRGLEWHTRYQIIFGILRGLHYLHKHMGIIHMDLKPGNILLDDLMVPKITDFGLSGSIDSQATTTLLISQGYVAPEYISQGKATSKSDIYSLGVIIIELVTGSRTKPNITYVLRRWSHRWFESTMKQSSLGYQQVAKCLELALRCIQDDPTNRPDISEIIYELEQDLVPRVKSLTDQQGTSVTEGDANSEVVQSSQGLYPETVHEDSSYMELNNLERIIDESEEPGPLDFTLLYYITENFSEKNKIGSGGCGTVYMGRIRNRVVAVKKLHNSRTIKNKMFHREVISLISVKHQNIVRFLGYCSFTKEHAVPYGGITIMADIRERLLCFEYIRNGSLDKHISDELRGLKWQTRYQIIIGICRGLHYLHKDKEFIHMDLKPGNILLDDLMVPKITDFGLSRAISDSQATTTLLISQGYVAPEYILRGKATSKSDIYSLGVIIIELVTGSRTKPNITKVLRKWNHRWIKSTKQSSLGYRQVAKCLELALRCIQDVPTDRPDISDIIDEPISDIIDELKEIDTPDGQTPFQINPCCLEDILGIEPLDIHIDFEDFKIPHSIELTNNTDDYIAFVTKAKLERFYTDPDRGIVAPRSKCSVTLAMHARVNERPNEHYTEVITVLSSRVDHGRLATLDIVTAGDIFIDSEEGKLVDEVNVMVVFGTPELPEEES